MLEVEHLMVSYGAAAALRGVSLAMGPGEMVCVIGANGAGKSTLLRAISGLIRPLSGQVRYENRAIQGMEPREIVRLGIGHCPEGRRIFAGLTIEENLEVGTAAWRRLRQRIEPDLKFIFEVFPHLASRRRQLGWSLSGGEQQMLAIGRALMSRPRLLLLDEPSLGLAPIVVRELFARIREINRQGMSILLVEQNARLAVETSTRGYLLENGRVTLAGDREALMADPRVKEAYLGA
jgi:branched-chain amino acid transport system ATP-binding protein